MALFERFHLSQEEAEARLKRALTGDPTRGEIGLLASLNANKYDDVQTGLSRDTTLGADLRDLVAEHLQKARARWETRKAWSVRPSRRSAAVDKGVSTFPISRADFEFAASTPSSAMARSSFLRCPSERPSRSRSLSFRLNNTSLSTSLATKLSTYSPRPNSSNHLRISRSMIAIPWLEAPHRIASLRLAIYQA